MVTKDYKHLQVAFLSAFAVVYGLYHEKTGGELSNLEYTLFNGLARMAWGFSLAWVIFSCTKGMVANMQTCYNLLIEKELFRLCLYVYVS